VTKVYCRECGYQNTEEGKYCSKCGALLPEEDIGSQTTIRFSPDVEEKVEDAAIIPELAGEGVSLVVRSGGDMAGESFKPVGEKTTIGRHPSSDIFLDDITVSRNHAHLIRKEDGYYIQDQGSLNGTYVNHVRVETQKLSDGDQVQIGKYKLTFIER
jgi:hypothetical protein